MTDRPTTTTGEPSLQEQISEAQATVIQAVTNYTNNSTETNYDIVVQAQSNYANLTGQVFADDVPSTA